MALETLLLFHICTQTTATIMAKKMGILMKTRNIRLLLDWVLKKRGKDTLY